MAKRSNFENDLIARGAAARLYELELERRRLVAILSKHGRNGTVTIPDEDGPSLPDITRATVKRTRAMYLSGRAEARKQTRVARKAGRRRKMSAAARKRISDAQKARWAKQRAAKK